MRAAHTIVALLVLLCVSCSDNIRTFHLSGSGTGAGDTLYLYGMDNRYPQMDTIVAGEDGKFSHTVPADTLFPLGLLMPTGKEIVIYAEPDISAAVTPDSIRKNSWKVTSGTSQHTYDSIAAILEPLGVAQRQEKITSFVEENPLNEVGIMLFRRYLIEHPAATNRHMREITNKFGGRLQDNDYILATKKKLEQKSSTANILYASMPSFDYKEMDDSTKISNKRYKEKFTVLSFWASWDTLSRKHLKAITDTCRRYKKEQVTLLNISLDHDTAKWRNIVLADTIGGDNVCDMKMWNNALVKRYNVNTLPYSVIIGPQLMSVSYNIAPDKLGHKLDSLINRHEEEKKKQERLLKKKRR